MIPGIEALACGPLAVPEDVMAHVVNVESSRNPFAIGVVGGRLQHQPRNLAEAVSTAAMLEERGYNYSVGLAQVNRINFERFGLDTPESRFDPCRNLVTGAKILAECLQRHEGRWGDAFSCYYSGNARTGYEHGYVQKVFASMELSATGSSDADSAGAIPLAGQAPNARPRAPARVEPRSLGVASSARIGAPAASRVESLASNAPLVRGGAAFESLPSQPPPAGGRAFEARPLAITDRNVEGDSPEARFIGEIHHQARASTILSSDLTTIEDARVPEPHAHQAGETQQESKRQIPDAARVF